MSNKEMAKSKWQKAKNKKQYATGGSFQNVAIQIGLFGLKPRWSFFNCHAFKGVAIEDHSYWALAQATF